VEVKVVPVSIPVPVPEPLPVPPPAALVEEPASIEEAAEQDHDAGASDMALATELLGALPPASIERERADEDIEEVGVEEVARSAGGAAAATIESPRPGTAGLGDLLANASVRLALFAGAEGGEGAGAIAFSAARQAAKHKVRCVVIDAGRAASNVLGHERPGLGELLIGEAAFGEVIQRDETARVHVIPLGGLTSDTPMERMPLVIGALTHTYDKVIVVADKVDDWPDDYFRPDLAAIVCGPDTTESLRTELYDFVLARGAHSAIIVRYTSDFDLGDEEESAAA
jgi:Mrp family chromosome partitioning ATPase